MPSSQMPATLFACPGDAVLDEPAGQSAAPGREVAPQHVLARGETVLRVELDGQRRPVRPPRPLRSTGSYSAPRTPWNTAGSTRAATSSVSAIWPGSGGAGSDLGVNPTGSADAFGVNDNQQIVGRQGGRTSITPWLRNGTTVTNLPPLGDSDDTEALGENGNGVVVGSAAVGRNAVDRRLRIAAHPDQLVSRVVNGFTAGVCDDRSCLRRVWWSVAGAGRWWSRERSGPVMSSGPDCARTRPLGGCRLVTLGYAPAMRGGCPRAGPVPPVVRAAPR